MEKYSMDGHIHAVLEKEQKTATFAAQTFVISTMNDRYAQLVSFQFTNDRCDLLQNFSKGDKVRVSFDIQGREWNGKFFTNLSAWKIERLDESGNVITPVKKEITVKSGGDTSFPTTEQYVPPAPVAQLEEDDLPF